MFDSLIEFIRELYGTSGQIPLHEPRFIGREKEILSSTIDSSYVSSAGPSIQEFEEKIAEYTGSRYAIATVNGTSALHAALLALGVKKDTEVITQSLTFVATSNAIRYCGAKPIFLDVDRETLGLSHHSLAEFLRNNCEIRDDGACWNKVSNKKISACLPMHTFGFPVKINKIKEVCKSYNLKVIEDAAESLGSFYKGTHTGRTGELSCLSFNGNKIITTGGGGMVLTQRKGLARKTRELTTTARRADILYFRHTQVAFNYRMPNINAALGIAQMESLETFLLEKKELAARYRQFGEENNMYFFNQPKHSDSNFWLNTIITKNLKERNLLLESTNKAGINTRPLWTPMHLLSMNKDCIKDEMLNTEWLFKRIVNVPSSVIVSR